MSEQAAASQLRAIIERVERLDEEIAGLNADKRDLFAEAKGNGFDVKALKTVLGIRRKDAAERSEHNAIVALYLSTLGMAAAAEEVEQNDPRVHVQGHAREATPIRSDDPPSSTSPQDTGAKAGSSISGESSAPGPADEDTRESADEAPRDDQGDGVEAATAAPSQSVEKVVPAATAEGDGLMRAAGPVADEAAGSNSPERASESGSRPHCRQPQPKQPIGGDSRRDGTPSIARGAAEAAVAARLAPKPLDPADKLYPILFKARHGRDPSPAEMAGASA